MANFPFFISLTSLITILSLGKAKDFIIIAQQPRSNGARRPIFRVKSSAHFKNLTRLSLVILQCFPVFVPLSFPSCRRPRVVFNGSLNILATSSAVMISGQSRTIKTTLPGCDHTYYNYNPHTQGLHALMRRPRATR